MGIRKVATTSMKKQWHNHSLSYNSDNTNIRSFFSIGKTTSKYAHKYFQLIRRLRVFRHQFKIEYGEWHHIIPVSLGGTDIPSNLILVGPKEHYLLHWLLVKHFAYICKKTRATKHPKFHFYRNCYRKMISALNTMRTHGKNKHVSNIKLFNQVKDNHSAFLNNLFDSHILDMFKAYNAFKCYSSITRWKNFQKHYSYQDTRTNFLLFMTYNGFSMERYTEHMYEVIDLILEYFDNQVHQNKENYTTFQSTTLYDGSETEFKGLCTKFGFKIDTYLREPTEKYHYRDIERLILQHQWNKYNCAYNNDEYQNFLKKFNLHHEFDIVKAVSPLQQSTNANIKAIHEYLGNVTPPSDSDTVIHTQVAEIKIPNVEITNNINNSDKNNIEIATAIKPTSLNIDNAIITNEKLNKIKLMYDWFIKNNDNQEKYETNAGLFKAFQKEFGFTGKRKDLKDLLKSHGYTAKQLNEINLKSDLLINELISTSLINEPINDEISTHFIELSNVPISKDSLDNDSSVKNNIAPIIEHYSFMPDFIQIDSNYNKESYSYVTLCLKNQFGQSIQKVIPNVENQYCYPYNLLLTSLLNNPLTKQRTQILIKEKQQLTTHKAKIVKFLINHLNKNIKF